MDQIKLNLSIVALLLLILLPSVQAIGLIPNSQSYSVKTGQTIQATFQVKGGPVAQDVILFVKSPSTDLKVEGSTAWEQSIKLTPGKIESFTVDLTGVNQNNNVQVEWGALIPPNNSQQGVSFQQVVKDLVNVKVTQASTSTPSNPRKTPTSSGGSSGASPVPPRVGNGTVNTTNTSVANVVPPPVPPPSNPVPITPSAAPVLTDIAPQDSSLTQGVIPSQSSPSNPTVPQLTTTTNVNSNSKVLTEVFKPTKQSVGLIVVASLICFGSVMFLLSTHLRRKVYE
jgi:hypothetical protein